MVKEKGRGGVAGNKTTELREECVKEEEKKMGV